MSRMYWALFVVVLTSFAHAKHPKHVSKQQIKASEWTVYQSADFDESDLCQVLNCRKDELCLVRENNAMCIHKHRMHEIEGNKKHFERYSKHDEHGKKDQKVTEDEYRDKLAKYHAKLQKHQSNKPRAGNEYFKPEKPNKPARSHKSEKEVAASCPSQELRNIGGRLLQWFSDVHKVEKNAGNVKSLPKHHISCRPDVGWMFQQWDGDDDGLLTSDELKSLEEDKYETCIRPFLDRCDVNADELVSLDEWCDCFQYTGYERKEPPCHAARREHDPHLLGSMHVRCDVDGYYRPEQCHERMCWCVDKYGREFDHSRAHGRADCGQYAEKDSDDEDLESLIVASGDGKQKEL